jgi:N-formylglutamate deformylase
MSVFTVTQGAGPVVLGMPHGGTDVPAVFLARLNARGRELADTDWHIAQLYNGLRDDVTVVAATFHRYVIDANRSPADDSLYPGQNTTGLVPRTDFDGQPIWDSPPDASDIAARRTAFHAPYHAALSAELDRVRALHGVAILLDCHSIRSRIPFLFDGKLPDLNIGTNGGVTCAAPIEDAVAEICSTAKGYNAILNGRFRGGWTTRHYGRPDEGLHAIQLEIAQSAYLETEAAPFAFARDKATRLRATLGRILDTLTDLAPAVKGTP